MIRLVRDFNPMAKVKYAAMDLLAGQRTHSAHSLCYGCLKVGTGMTLIVPRYNLIVHMEEEARHAVLTHQRGFGSTSRESCEVRPRALGSWRSAVSDHSFSIFALRRCGLRAAVSRSVC